MAALVGLVLVSGLCLVLSLWSLAVGDRGGYATMGESAAPWRATLVVLVVYIPLHELLHLLGQPDWGAVGPERGRAVAGAAAVWGVL